MARPEPRAAAAAARGARVRSAASAGERGFSILELVVAMAVMLVALLLAADLLDESGRLLRHSVRRARDPLPLLGSELLRNDLRAARPPLLASGWTGGPLALDVPGEGPVVWHRQGDRVWRRGGGADRPRLGGVAVWRWRALPGAVEVRIELATSGAWLRQTRAGLPRGDQGGREVLRLLVAGRGGVDGW